MKIGIIGAGNMGCAFASRLTKAGHEIAITAKNILHAEKAAAAAGGSAHAVSLDDVARASEMLILATPYAGAVDALRAAGDIGGKTVVDITNPLNAEMSGMTLGYTTSAAEEIQHAMPDVRLVKAFNTIFAQVLGGTAKAQVLYAGDDGAAKEAVRGLIESAGFETMDCGPLANARYLEPLGMLNIYLGYGAARGTAIAPAWASVD